MARYRTTVPSQWPLEEAFRYMSDFSNAVHWDPGVTSAQKISTGEVGLGSKFDLVATFNGRSMPLMYEVTAFDPPRRVVLRAETPLVVSLDEITVASTHGASDVTYDATLRTRGWLRLVAPVVSVMFRGIGERARAGLARELNR
ncbi:MAG: hypothetical protein HIU57_09525 [Acidobacteria bacterium]|nr:hypothetical protein [Acidobacteriota bacterium]